MAEESKSTIYEHSSEYNWTDPYVVINREYPHNVITIPDESDETNNITTDYKRINGIEIPIISINNMYLPWNNVIYMNLSSIGFYPRLVLIIEDRTEFFQTFNSPGMNNSVTVVMTMPIDGAYEKISIDFYILSYEQKGSQIKYDCMYKCDALNGEVYKAWTSDRPKIGDNPRYPNTFELLKKIAVETGLGFACTDKCEEINDDKIRIAQRQSYGDIIQQHIQFGGLDSNSIFDAWIDLYGYITMVNLPWILNEEIKIDQLKHHAVLGITGANREAILGTNNPKYTDLINRFVSDNADDAYIPSNFKIYSYKDIINNNDAVNNGTITEYYAVDHTSVGGNNSVKTSSDVFLENSNYIGNNVKGYMFTKFENLGTELGDTTAGNTPVLFQTNRRNIYLASKRQRILEVTLEKPNFAFIKGILIGVDIHIKNFLTKEAAITANFITSSGKAIPEFFSSAVIGMSDGELNSENYGPSDIMRTGLYYIDGVSYEYNADTRRIFQTLFLIKKDKYTNYADSLADAVKDKSVSDLLG